MEENCRGRRIQSTPRNINYYRDVFLLCPFLIFSLASVFKLINRQWVVGTECIGIVIVVVPAFNKYRGDPDKEVPSWIS